MGLQIEDGGGSGKIATVDSDGKLDVRAIVHSHDFNINRASGKVWSCPFGPRDPTGASDYVFYIKNTGSADLSITDVRLSTTGAIGRFQLNLVTGTAASGTTVVPVSRNTGSTAAPVATIEDGVNITGLTTAGTLFYMECDAVSKVAHLSTSANIILAKGGAFGILAESATSVVTGVVSVVELD